MRLGSANAYDNALANMTNRQKGLSELQDKLSAGKKVVRASDDPTGAAQAERSRVRQTRVDVEQRALNLQRNSMAMAEATLGDTQSSLQRIRELVVNAGDGTLTPINRSSIAQEIRGLRDQIFTYANKQDSNGVPLFGGLGSASNPFTDSVTGVGFNGISGERSSTTVSIPSAMDGKAIFMNVPTGNGVFNVGINAANQGQLWTDVGQVTSPSQLTGGTYVINFHADSSKPGSMTYDVTDVSQMSSPEDVEKARTVLAKQPYVEGQAIRFEGMSFVAQGMPAEGDTVRINPALSSDLFSVLDATIAAIDKQPGNNRLMQNISRSLAQIDNSMDRLQSARGVAGELLKRADIIDGNQRDKTIQLESDRSRAEDMDMTHGISAFQNQQTGYQAALQTYAQIHRMSLFDFLG
jgi:flagellar hook-associated protein 3 FlgL